MNQDTASRLEPNATETGAYALDAMTTTESVEFERYLEGDEVARAEVTELTDTAIQLGMSVRAELPSAALRGRILDQLETTPQLRVSATPAEPARASTSTPSERRAAQRWFSRPVAIATAAAAAVVLIVAGVALSTLPTGIDHTKSPITAIQLASDVHHQTVAIAGGGVGTVTWSASAGRSMVRTVGLPAVGRGKTYELWYISGGKATPAGTFESSGNGSTQVVLTGRFLTGATVGLTVEPAPGSTSPTTAPILAVATS